MGYMKTRSGARRPRKKGFLARVLGAFGDSRIDGVVDNGGDTSNVNLDDLPDPNAYFDTGGSNQTTQDTTVLVDGQVVGGQPSGQPTAGPVVGAWQNVNGVCYATNESFLETLKELQRQANRCAEAFFLTKIGVDGKIGPGTLTLLAAIAKKGAFNRLASPTMTCYNVCQYAAAFTAAMSAAADAAGAAGSVSSPSGDTPAIWSAQTGKIQPQGFTGSAKDAWGNLSSTEQLAIAGGLAAVGFWAYKDAKKKSRARRRA